MRSSHPYIQSPKANRILRSDSSHKSSYNENTESQYRNEDESDAQDPRCEAQNPESNTDAISENGVSELEKSRRTPKVIGLGGQRHGSNLVGLGGQQRSSNLVDLGGQERRG
jgi:hypothetical protein